MQALLSVCTMGGRGYSQPAGVQELVDTRDLAELRSNPRSSAVDAPGPESGRVIEVRMTARRGSRLDLSIDICLSVRFT
ncbi:hypothetical protein CH278_09425 [Rhodococcus sp. 05-2254-5]|nr:hypothetical protein CH278_09425 [Rhodococcus sp. 05-2254-5]OZE51897.1 hypothetical protein CH269_24340 [Rhodococcus sp. 05-2254-1]